MAEYFLKTDSCNTLALEQTLTRGSTFVKLTGQNLIDPRRDDTLTRLHENASVIRRTADDVSRPTQQTELDPSDPCYTEDNDDEKSNALSGLALARLQHRAKKSTTTKGNAATRPRLQERRGSNPDRSTRLACDDSTSHMTSETSSHREAHGARSIERPTSSWASRSGRRPNFTESGWEIEDDDFVGSGVEKMAINESNSYASQRDSFNNEAPSHSSSQGKNSLSQATGNQEKLTRRSSDSSRARSYKEVAKELRRESLLTGSQKKKEENHSNGGGISMTDGELARMRAVSRLTNATPQLTSESTSSMASTNRHLPRKLNPLPVNQVVGTDMALDEEEEEKEAEESQLTRQHRRRCASWGTNRSVDEQPAARRRGSREQEYSAAFFSDPNAAEKNINPRPKLKPIRKK